MPDKRNRDNSLKKWDDKLNSIFEYVFEHSLIGMAILNSNGRFIRINKKASEIWEYTEIELIGKTWQDITHKDDIEESSQFVDSYKNQPQHYNSILEKRYITGNGKVKTCRITVSIMTNLDGKLEHSVVQIQDMSQKKEILSCVQKGLDLIKKYKKNSIH